MNEKYKIDMYNRIVSNNSNSKEQMYNRIISNYNNYNSNKKSNVFENSNEKKIKFNNVWENSKEKFKNAISNLDSIKKKRYDNADTFTKVQAIKMAAEQGKDKVDVANSILNNRKKLKVEEKSNNNLANKVIPALTAPLMLNPITSKFAPAILGNSVQMNDNTKYIAKKTGVGVLGGLNGLMKAGTTEIQNNMQKGAKENKSILENVNDIISSAQTNLNPTLRLANMGKNAFKEGIKTIKDKNTNPIQKLANMANNASSNALDIIPGKNVLDNYNKMVGNINKDSDKMVGEMSDIASKPYNNLKEKIQQEGQKYNSATQTAGNVAEVVGNMVPSIGASMVAGPEAGLLTTGISAKGTATEEALAKGAELDQAVKIGNTKGIVEVGTELLSGGINFFGKGALDDIVEKGLIDKVSNKVGKFLIRQGYDFSGEVGEEVVSDIVGTLIDKGTVDPNAKYSIEDLGETTATTILSTAVLKALGVPVNNISDVIMNNKQKNVQSEENNTSQSIEIQKEKESNISNRLEDKNSQNAISGQIEENNTNVENFVQENTENQTNMKNKAQNYINRSKSQFINDLVSDLQTSKYSNKEILNQSVDEIINEINNNNGKVSKEKADELFENLYGKLVKTDSDYYNQYKDLKEDLRKTKLFVPENVANDISDFGDFRKNNRGNLILTNDNSNVNIDTKYKELSETYPELFPADITNQSDQLQKISEVVRDIKKTETNVQAYLDKNMGSDYKMWAREDFNRILNKFQKDVNMAYRYNADNPQKSKLVIAKDELKEIYNSLPQLRRNYEKVMNKEVLTERDRVQVDRLLKNEITIDELPKNVNKQGIINVFNAKQPLNAMQEAVKEHKKNIRELRIERAQELLGDLSKWKDKKIGWLYSRETASRNVYDIAPKETAEAIVKEYIEPYHINEADAIRLQNKYTNEIKDLKLSSHKKYKATFSMQEMLDGELKDVVKTKKVSEAELVQIFGEGRITLDQLQETGVNTQKIIKSVETFRKIYNELFDMVNNVLLNNGLEPVQKRENYFPHFSEAEPDNLLSKAAKLAGIDLSGELLPTDIAGKTQNFKPNKKFVGNFLQRSTDITDFNALKGFDRYIQGVTDVIYHTEDIMKLRALSDSIRNFYSTKEIKSRIQNIEESTELTTEEKNEKINEIKEQTVNKSNLSNFITWLDNYINILAGKKSINDRGAEKELSRKVYKAMNKVESRIGANMVAGNIGVSFTNLAPLAQASAECSVPNLVKGLYGSMIANGKAIIGKRDTSFASESDFITRRRGTETTTTSFIDKVTKPLDIITSSIDDVISEGIVRARYIQNLKNGMTQQEALHEADTYSASLMADRSKGAMPTQFYSTNPLAKMVNMFQVEVNNQYSYYFKDMKRNIQDNSNTKAQMVAKMTKSYAKLLIASYAMNELISNVRGNATRVLPDPIYLVKELIKGLGNDDRDDDWETLNGTTKEILGNTPFASVPLALFGNAFGLDSENIGRVSIAGAIPDVSKVGSTLMSDSNSEYKKETVKKELEKPLYNLIFPKAGSQVKKTVQGAEAVAKGGSYSTTKNGEKKLQFNIDRSKGTDVAKALVFGKWSVSNAQNYDNKPLTEKQQQEIKELNISFNEYKKYQSDLSDLNKIEADKDSKGKSISGSANAKKAYQIMNSDKYSDDEKNYLIKKLYSEDSKYKITANQLKKIDNSEESYKYFFGLSNEKQKEFFNDMKEYNFTSKKLIEYYKDKDKIDNKYEKEVKNIKAKGYNSDIEKDMISDVNQKKKNEIAENLISSKYSDKQKLYLYSKSYKTNDVEMVQKLNINANSFIKFDSQNFESDYNANGKTIKNSKLNKVVNYVEGLPNLTVAQKAFLIKSEMSSYKKYDNQIIEYIDSQKLSTKEKEEILKNVGFKIKNGRVYD